MKFFLFSLILLSSCLYAGTTDLPFEGEYRFWSDSGDYDSLRIVKRNSIYRVCLIGSGSELLMECRPVSNELLSDEIQGIRYYFVLNGDNEIRMRKEFLRVDRPEDIEWLFYRI